MQSDYDKIKGFWRDYERHWSVRSTNEYAWEWRFQKRRVFTDKCVKVLGRGRTIEWLPNGDCIIAGVMAFTLS